MTLNHPRSSDPRRMSKPELSERLSALLNTPAANRSGAARERELQSVLHELEVYQIELEMQVRELRESQTALAESNERYLSLYDFAPVGYLTLNIQGLIQEINLTAADMLGVERKWLHERFLTPWILAADLPLYRAHLKQCREAGGTVRSLLRLARRDKQVVPIELSTVCLNDPKTGSPQLRTTLIDLSDRRRAEADLDRFFNLSTDLLCISGTDGYFKRVNPAFEDTLGYSRPELMAHPMSDFVHPDDREAATAAFQKSIQRGMTQADYKVRFLRKNRTFVWLSWNSILSGGLLYCVARDITAQEQEKDLRELFVNTLTHDLRQPLTVIKINAQLLGGGRVTPAMTVKITEQLAKNALRVEHMIEDLLDTNKIRSGEQLPLTLTDCDLTPLIRSTLADLTTVYGDRFALIAPENIQGHWSKQGLRRVIENLAVNAVKYGSPHHPVTISTRREGSHVVILVKNLGNPIPLEEQPRLFDQFIRARSAEAGAQKGWGLGLTLVRGIVMAHGGEVTVESSESEGTIFRVNLPLAAKSVH